MTVPPLRTYGRTKARTLKPRQAALVETLLPHLAVPAEGAIDVAQLFPSPLVGEGSGEGGRADAQAPDRLHAPHPPAPAPRGGGGVVLEIGFGGGEHLVAQAAAHPEQRYIGVEPFLNGVASCLRHIEENFFPFSLAEKGLGDEGRADAQALGSLRAPHPPTPSPQGRGGVERVNIRLHYGDARDVIARLPDACLDLVYILFPDPWPKTRHHKRRLIQREFLDQLARVTKPNAELRFVTDWANYASWTLWHFAPDARFIWNAERADDWRKPWPGHATTRYEQKRLGDCAPIWLRFVRRWP